MNAKSALTWLAGLVAPVIGDWLPDMIDGHAPQFNVWRSLALMLIGAGLVNMKTPAQHKDGAAQAPNPDLPKQV